MTSEEFLFAPFRSGVLNWPGQGDKTLFLNAFSCPDLRKIGGEKTLQSFSFRQTKTLEKSGFSCGPVPEGRFDAVFLAAPRQMEELRAALAGGLERLREGGLFLCAAPKNAGGQRLAGLLKEAGLAPTVISESHAKIVFAHKKSAINTEIIAAWKTAGARQNAPTNYVSQPGLFAWDRVDTGSALLAAHLPSSLSGKGVDFGCGYGFLSCYALRHCQNIENLTAIDDDWRAVSCCTENMAQTPNPGRGVARWGDATDSGLSGLDFVLMNPPFHESRPAQVQLGQSFIMAAAAALRPGGDLWMVSNAHLPYENALHSGFSSVRRVAEENGYKIHHAVR